MKLKEALNERFKSVSIEEIDDIFYYILEKDIFTGSYIHTTVEHFNYDTNYLFVTDQELGVIIPIQETPYGHKYIFEKLIEIPKTSLDCCIECGATSISDVMFNLNPDLNEGLSDLKEDYIDYSGVVCPSCYRSFCKENN